MKKQIPLIAFILLNCIFSLPVLSQTLEFDWVKQTGNVSGEMSHALTVDHEGNSYSAGAFGDTVDFDPGPGVFNLYTDYSTDLFIQKLDSNGNFIWAKSLQYSMGNSGSLIKSIITDTLGNIFISGRFNDMLDFDPGPGTHILIANSYSDGFILKLDSNGEFLWAFKIGESGEDDISSMHLDELGHLYVTGFFRGTIDFDPGPDVYNITSTTYGNDYILKLDVDGNFVWAKQIGDGYEELYTTSMSSDENDNVYITGHFTGTKDFDLGSGVNNLTSNGNSDFFLLKLDSIGDFVWVKQFGGTSKDIAKSMTIDQSNHLLITGSFLSTVDFDPGPGIEELNPIGRNTYILKLNLDGELIWVKTTSGIIAPGQSPRSEGYSIITDHLNNVYVTGYFKGLVDFDPGVDTFILTSEELYVKDSFIQKLDSNGNFIWAGKTKGTNYESPRSIALDHYHNLLCLGSFENTVDFDPNAGVTNLTAIGYYDIFLQKFNQCDSALIPDVIALPVLNGICTINQPLPPTASNNCVEGINGVSNLAFPILDQSVTEIIWTYDDGYGNVTTQTQAINWTALDITTTQNGFTITANNTNATYQWLDCDNNYNQIIGDTNINYTAITNGNYAVEISDNGCIDTSACVIIAGIGLDKLDDLTLSVFPNPSLDVFNITFEKEIEQAVLAVSNLLGQSVYTKKVKQTSTASINLKDKPSGLYFLTITSKKSQKTIELIKE